MSLLNRLLISVSLVIICILAGMVALSVNSARSYLRDQLLVSTENTATSMAITLSQPSNQDPSTRQLLLTALYDSGQFKLVRLGDSQGKTVFLRDDSSDSGPSVPAWFDRVVALHAPVSTRQVSSGWAQSGELTLQLDPSFAVRTLWNNATQVIMLVLLVGFAWVAFAIVLVRWFKRSLETEIQQRLVRVKTDPVRTPDDRVSIPELETVGSLVSDFRERVLATEHALTEQLESLSLELNSDDVTGLPNRRYFINALHEALQGQASGTGKLGHVLVLRLRDLAWLSRSTSRAEVDDWLKGVAKALSDDLGEYQSQGAMIGRLNGSDFGVLLPGVAGPVATRIAQELRQRVSMFPSPVRHKPGLRWAIALADYLPGNDVGSVLARLDYRLMRAESAGGQNAIEYSSHGDVADSSAHGGEQWRTLLQQALAENRMTLSIEKRNYANGSHVQISEAYLQLSERDDPASVMSAYLFMPPAARVGLSGACDLRSIRLALVHLKQTAETDLVVRVSGASLLDRQFNNDLRQLLHDVGAGMQGALKCLILEIDAQNLVMCALETREFCKLAAEFGIRVGIRRLGQRPDALMVLQMAKFHYLKLGGEFIKHLATSMGASHFVSAVIETAHDLSIRVYVEDVNDSQTLSLLRSKGAYVCLD
jgi:EAL domain-containing protein (putative c-di-GMP-specific phosphodiesterase class I)